MLTLPMNVMRIALIFGIVLIIGCQGHQEMPLRPDIAAVMDDYTEDFLLTPLHEVFSLEQLAWMLVHREHLSDAINARILDHSTLAIQIAVYLRLETAISVLREKVLTLRDTYGWEGPDYSQPDPWMWETQYPYHRIYIWAIQGIAGAPLHAVIKLTDAERDFLQQKAALARTPESFPDTTGDSQKVDGRAWCAKWLLTLL